MPFFATNGSNPIISKVVYTLRVMTPEELKRYNLDMYYEYYGPLVDMPKMPVDALRVARHEPIPLATGRSSGQEGSNELFRLGAGVDNAIGAPLGLASLLTGNNNLGNAGSALTGLSILHDIDRGEYWSAGGKSLLFAITQISSKANVYATIISFSTWIYQTNYMQEELARGYAREYKHYMSLYIMESKRKRPNQSALDKYSKQMNTNLKLFKQCMDNLGISY